MVLLIQWTPKTYQQMVITINGIGINTLVPKVSMENDYRMGLELERKTGYFGSCSILGRPLNFSPLPMFKTHWKNAWRTPSRLIGLLNLLDTLFANLCPLAKVVTFYSAMHSVFPFPVTNSKTLLLPLDACTSIFYLAFYTRSCFLVGSNAQ